MSGYGRSHHHHTLGVDITLKSPCVIRRPLWRYDPLRWFCVSALVLCFFVLAYMTLTTYGGLALAIALCMAGFSATFIFYFRG